jgi:DNA-directed RNA polymerases I and III subunit RPAC1
MRILEQPSPMELVFEMLGVDTSFANALRRILLAQVPTVALEHVYMWNNSSIIHDEVLAHRLGLVPLAVDARLLDAMDDDEGSNGDAAAPTDRNTVVFRLAVSCPKEKPPPTNSSASVKQQQQQDTVVHPPSQDCADWTAAADQVAAATRNHRSAVEFPADRPYTKHVYSSDLIWIPQGDQEERFGESGIRPVLSDILLAKLRPGQSIELEAHGRVGIGKDHAKYSPVATASYRLAAHIELIQPVYDEDAEELVHVYEPGVFELVPATDLADPPGARCKAVVVNPYACTMSRNFMRHPVLQKSIRMSRIADHFIFSVESVGTYSPGVLVAEALRILQRKCLKLKYNIEESQAKMEMS